MNEIASLRQQLVERHRKIGDQANQIIALEDENANLRQQLAQAQRDARVLREQRDEVLVAMSRWRDRAERAERSEEREERQRLETDLEAERAAHAKTKAECDNAYKLFPPLLQEIDHALNGPDPDELTRRSYVPLPARAKEVMAQLAEEIARTKQWADTAGEHLVEREVARSERDAIRQQLAAERDLVAQLQAQQGQIADAVREVESRKRCVTCADYVAGQCASRSSPASELYYVPENFGCPFWRESMRQAKAST